MSSTEEVILKVLVIERGHFVMPLAPAQDHDEARILTAPTKGEPWRPLLDIRPVPESVKH